MPWSEIGPLHAQNDPMNFPTSFDLTAVSDFGLLTCERNWTLDVEVHDNPEIAALPAEEVLCDNGDLDLEADVLLNPNGGVGFHMDRGCVRRLQHRGVQWRTILDPLSDGRQQRVGHHGLFGRHRRGRVLAQAPQRCPCTTPQRQ